MKTSIKIGTRGSQLALYQAALVKAKIEQDFRLVSVEIVTIKTSGDMIRRGGGSVLETKRIFTKEIEDALLEGEIDLAVHSAKDMSAILPEGLEVGAVLEREDPRDCLLTKDQKKLGELPLGSRIGTGSLRRKQQLLRYYPELIVEDMHGNVDSRIRKMEEGHYDGIVLAYAGMKRLDLVNKVSEVFSAEEFYPAPGQGIIVVESRAGDSEVTEFLTAMQHLPSAIQLRCERAFLRRLEGGCQLPCGMVTNLGETILMVRGAIFALEGNHYAELTAHGSPEDPEKVGIELAENLLAAGGQEILDKIRSDNA